MTMAEIYYSKLQDDMPYYAGYDNKIPDSLIQDQEEADWESNLMNVDIPNDDAYLWES